VADQLGAGITAELQTLGMGGARVEVSVAALGGKGDVEVDGARLTALGVDQVEFLIAPNPGEQPRPLRQVASGGELSRALLALKQVLAGLGPVGLYVFDEVDTGVGGAVAEVIGRKLWQVAQPGQALCITHLPQVAAWGDRHLRVEKQVREGRTHSGVVRLPDGEARVEELARMLGGVVVTAGARQAAADLLDQATAWRRSVR
jgi:DNA repair protein RecN (Recombination protein N)